MQLFENNFIVEVSSLNMTAGIMCSRDPLQIDQLRASNWNGKSRWLSAWVDFANKVAYDSEVVWSNCCLYITV